METLTKETIVVLMQAEDGSQLPRTWCVSAQWRVAFLKGMQFSRMKPLQ
jgi:hypothetical protein